jgi:hypothetical protein
MPSPEQLAVIRKPKFGVDDLDTVSLRFTVYISEAGAADQRLSPEDAIRALKDAGVDDVSRLDGRTCWVTVDRGIVQFQRMATL